MKMILSTYKKFVVVFLFIPIVVFGQIVLEGNVLQNTPVILDASNATYILNEDFTAQGSAFVVAGGTSGITLDLNGHTVVFNADGGNYRYGVLIAGNTYNSTNYPDIPSNVFGNGGANNVVIKNGSILQDKNGGENSCNIFGTGREEIRIENVTLDTYGIDCWPIYFRYSNDLYIHDNLINNHSLFVTNRHTGRAAIDIENAREGNLEIYNNTITDSPQWGIRVTRNRNYTAQGFYYVYNNDIVMNTVVTNGYGIGAHADNMYVYGNKIHPVNGRGIHVTKNNIEVYDNYVDVFEKGNNEYEYLFAHGIKLENATNSEIYRNTVISHGRHDDTTYYVHPLTGQRRLTYGHGQALNITLRANSNCYIHDNYFLGIHDGGVGVRNNPWFDYAAAFYITILESNSGLIMENNTFESNSVLFYVSYDMPNGGGDLVLKNCTFRKKDTSITEVPFIETYHANNGAYSDIVFLDPIQENNVNLKNYQYLNSGENFDYSIAWSVDIYVQTDKSVPIPGAKVEIYDSQGTLVFTGETDGSGRVLMPLKESTIMRVNDQVNQVDYSPYRIVATFDAASAETQITVNKVTTVNLTLQGVNLDYIPTPAIKKSDK